MARSVVGLLVAVSITSGCRPQRRPEVLTVCDLSKDFAAYRDQVVAVRGIYYWGLRQACSQKCADGPWPFFLDLTGTGSAESETSWGALEKVEQTVELEAMNGKRLEIWVTAVGQIRTRSRRSPLGPCDKIGSGWYPGYGHLGAFPAQLVVQQFRDIEVKVNPGSPYDYGHMYHGPA
jgi:hypothetical protein